MKMFYEFADEMLQHIPPEEEGLIADLKKARETSLFQPPDGQPTAWRKAFWALGVRFTDNPPEADWEKKLSEVWNRECEAALAAEAVTNG